MTQHSGNAHTKPLSEKQDCLSHAGVSSDITYF